MLSLENIVSLWCLQSRMCLSSKESLSDRSFRDNQISISLRGYNWLQQWKKKLLMPVFEADGNNFLDIWKKSGQAIDFARKNCQPSCIIYNDIPRRFGHAATDRQVWL